LHEWLFSAIKSVQIALLAEEVTMKDANRTKEYLPGTERQSSRGYSPAVITRGGRTVYLAGHGGYSDESGKTYPGDFDAQVRIAFERIRSVLAKAGGTLDDIVSMTVFIVDMKNGDRFTELRRSFFSEGCYPGSALIGIKELAHPEMMLEIQAIAVID
jgi:enamine deaminase RidA (YjgF/YER057c/UK114 family)